MNFVSTKFIKYYILIPPITYCYNFIIILYYFILLI